MQLFLFPWLSVIVVVIVVVVIIVIVVTTIGGSHDIFGGRSKD